MLTVNNIRKCDLKDGNYCISIKGNYKFSITRTMKSITEKDFIDLANKKFYEKYQTDWKGVCRGAKRLTKFEKIINNRWCSINQRCVNGKYANAPSIQKSPQIQSYHKKGIALNITKEEFTTWMLSVEDNFMLLLQNNKKPSIDRIDETKGYEIGNLQILSLHENIEKRIGKTCNYTKPEDKLKKSLHNKKIYDRKVKGIIQEKVKKVKIKKPYISIKHKIEYNGIIFNSKQELATHLNIRPSTLTKRLKQNKIIINILPL